MYEISWLDAGQILAYTTFALASLIAILKNIWSFMVKSPEILDQFLNHTIFIYLINKLGYGKGDVNIAYNIFKYSKQHKMVFFGVFPLDTPYGRCIFFRYAVPTKQGDFSMRGTLIYPEGYYQQISSYDDICAIALRKDSQTKSRDTMISCFDLTEFMISSESGSEVRGKSMDISEHMTCQEDLHILMRDVQTFIDKKPLYASRKVLWKKTIGLHGEPGCGKTQFIYKLAADLGGSNVYFCAPNTNSLDKLKEYAKPSYITVDLDKQGAIELLEKSDEEIRSYIDNPKNSKFCPPIVVFDDIDHFLRGQSKSSISLLGPEDSSSPEKFLLELLDGPKSLSAIYILTMNDPSVLEDYSPALLRKGRCDTFVEVGPADGFMVDGLIKRYFPEETPTEDEFRVIRSAFVGRKIANIASFINIIETIPELVSEIQDLPVSENGTPILP